MFVFTPQAILFDDDPRELTTQFFTRTGSRPACERRLPSVRRLQANYYFYTNERGVLYKANIRSPWQAHAVSY
jgi:hypothetical protein